MCLWKAGVEYEDIRVTGPTWTALKESGNLEFGQVPHIVLADGTTMSQSAPALRYFGTTYGLMGKDAMSNYRGDKAVEHTMGDFFGKNMMPIMFAPEAERAEKLQALIAEGGAYRNWLVSLTDKCLGDSKFLCGDEVTIHDFCVAGLFVNLILNPNNTTAGPPMKAVYDEHAPERLKTYIADFRTAMAEYLTARE